MTGVQGWVACGECSTRYDSATFTFCPRCGSVRSTAIATTLGAVPQRPPAPLDRRLQLGGALLLALGLLAGSLAGYALGPGFSDVEASVGDLLLSQPGAIPGGTLSLRTLVDGVPTPANLTLLTGGLPFANLTSDGSGWANVTLGSNGAVEVRAEAANRTVVRRILVLEGTSASLVLDLARDPTDAPWHGLSLALNTGLGALAVAAALLAFGGIAALARRLRWLAYLGPLPALALGLFLALGAGVGGLAVAAMLGVAYGLVITGRSGFR
ncbi:MAG: hypothetical protein AABX89_04390 [Candidatus Thermoplasmatota archaeon]